jgi:hypothetical protein
MQASHAELQSVAQSLQKLMPIGGETVLEKEN